MRINGSEARLIRLSIPAKLGYQHFITDCPERDVPPEDYVCKICKTVSPIPIIRTVIQTRCLSQVTSFAIVRRRMLLAIPAERNRLRVMCAELALASFT